MAVFHGSAAPSRRYSWRAFSPCPWVLHVLITEAWSWPIVTNRDELHGDAHRIATAFLDVQSLSPNPIEDPQLPLSRRRSPRHFNYLFSIAERQPPSKKANGEDLIITVVYAVVMSVAPRTSVLCSEYSGYGLSTAKHPESNFHADILAAYTYVVSEQRVSQRSGVLFRRSLVSGPTDELSTRLGSNVADIVLIAALIAAMTLCVRDLFNSPMTMKMRRVS